MLSTAFVIISLFSPVVFQARTIRRQIENKLPDDILCQKQSETSGVDFAEVRQKAETILNDLAKHLVALKASEERLNEEARRLYLQVTFRKRL